MNVASVRRYFVLLSMSFFLLGVVAALASCRAGQSETLPTIAEWTAPPTTSRSLAKVTDNEPDPNGVTLLAVNMADGVASIMVQFSGPPDKVGQWWQGSVYVIDEQTGTIYDQIPAVPVLGPLFGKPHEEGQAGYCMLVNFDARVQPGSVVSVVLGSYKREHVKVQ